MEDYTPTALDIKWARSTLDMVKEGGLWAAPATGNAYVVSHERKTLTRIATTDPCDLGKVHQRSIVVFREVGYEVKDILGVKETAK